MDTSPQKPSKTEGEELLCSMLRAGLMAAYYAKTLFEVELIKIEILELRRQAEAFQKKRLKEIPFYVRSDYKKVSQVLLQEIDKLLADIQTKEQDLINNNAELSDEELEILVRRMQPPIISQ